MTSRNDKKCSVRSALREATEAAHERLHQASPFVAIAEERLNLDQYAELFRRIAAFHFTVGRQLELDPRRCDLLARDLDALGTPEPAPLDWTAPASSAARLGSAYVIEGSSLGGKVIYRQLDYLFGQSTAGRHFFRGCDSDGARWRKLCGRIEAEGAEPGALDKMISGAQQTFALFEQHVAPVHANG